MSPAVDVAVVATGTANLASVLAGLRRAGAAPRVIADPASVRSAERIVLPGVGAFGAGMSALAGAGLVEALVAHLRSGKPFLGICLGLQLLAAASDESPGVRGLGVIAGTVTRLRGSGVRVPHLGWNRVTPDAGGRLLVPGRAYFANSYKLDAVPAGWRAARTTHGTTFVAALERGSQLLCQFHPELSGRHGHDLLRAWLGRARDGAGAEEAERGGAGAAALAVRVIPCLDTKDGRVVKGIRFAGLRDAGDPAERAALYERQGADELVLLDVSATPEGRGHALATVRRVREQLGIPLTVGGGVRAVDDAAALLEAGADKVSVNTAAVDDPELLARIATRFGRQCAVVAIDAARRAPSPGDGGRTGWEVVVQSGRRRTGIDAITWAREATRRGAGEILLTSFDRDGTREGYDLDLVSAVSGAVDVPVIASGGADAPAHLVDAVRAGADAVLAASIFHDGDRTVGDVKLELSAAGVEVRR